MLSCFLNSTLLYAEICFNISIQLLVGFICKWRACRGLGELSIDFSENLCWNVLGWAQERGPSWRELSSVLAGTTWALWLKKWGKKRGESSSCQLYLFYTWVIHQWCRYREWALSCLQKENDTSVASSWSATLLATAPILQSLTWEQSTSYISYAR